jgi:hypothetical protein
MKNIKKLKGGDCKKFKLKIVNSQIPLSNLKWQTLTMATTIFNVSSPTRNSLSKQPIGKSAIKKVLSKQDS